MKRNIFRLISRGFLFRIIIEFSFGNRASFLLEDRTGASASTDTLSFLKKYAVYPKTVLTVTESISVVL
jgi:hypothetical protein